MDDRFAYEKWWVTVGEEDRKLPPECLCPAAWNAAYSLGLAKGRKEGMCKAERVAVQVLEEDEGSPELLPTGFRIGCGRVIDAIRQATKDTPA